VAEVVLDQAEGLLSTQEEVVAEIVVPADQDPAVTVGAEVAVAMTATDHQTVTRTMIVQGNVMMTTSTISQGARGSDPAPIEFFLS